MCEFLGFLLIIHNQHSQFSFKPPKKHKRGSFQHTHVFEMFSATCVCVDPLWAVLYKQINLLSAQYTTVISLIKDSSSFPAQHMGRERTTKRHAERRKKKKKSRPFPPAVTYWMICDSGGALGNGVLVRLITRQHTKTRRKMNGPSGRPPEEEEKDMLVVLCW